MNIIENFKRIEEASDPSTKTSVRVTQLVHYLKKWSISSVVIGVSGGIDSTFTLMLLLEAKKQHPIEITTVFFTQALHAHEADAKVVHDFVRQLPVSHIHYDMGDILRATMASDGIDSPIVNTQYAYALMYTILFRIAQEKGAITVGTTNKDEFGIGWFGKTSDMVVDIQPIHDFHKFEIYSSPLMTHIPDNIKGVAPTGNILSGETDEEAFGCSYNVVSSLVDMMERQVIPSDLSDYPKLVELIRKNKHKLVKPKKEFNPIFIGV